MTALRLVHVESRRTDVGATRRASAAVADAACLVVLVQPDDSVELVPTGSLPPGDLPEVGLRHAEPVAAELLRLVAAWPQDTVVLAAVDRVARLAAAQVVEECDHVLALDTLDAAVRCVRMLESGQSADEVLHPPAFSAGLALADAGVSSDVAEVKVRVEQGTAAEPGVPWLELGDGELTVRTAGMSRRARRALASREGPRRLVTEPQERRLLLGPANYAGQGGEWARAVRRHVPGWTARNFHVTPPQAPLVFGADLPLTSVEWGDPATRLDLAVELVHPATHVVVEAMRPLLAALDPSDRADGWDPVRAREDLELLRASGRRVGVLFHGSELRVPSVHRELTPWSPFGGPESQALTAALERTTARVREAFADFEGPTFVSTPDLLDYLPGAHWVPGVVGPACFADGPAALEHDRPPVVAHAPSSSALKGSAWVDPVLEELDAQGLITYRRVHNLPPFMVPSLVREVDVVVDQVVMGNPGVLAAQAMAAGRLVVAHLPDHVRRRHPEPIPVVEATPATIRDVLMSVIEGREHYAHVAASGRDFARRNHDGRRSARVLTGGFDA